MKLHIPIDKLNDALQAHNCNPRLNPSKQGWIAACPVCEGKVTYRSSGDDVEYQCISNSCPPQEICRSLKIDFAVTSASTNTSDGQILKLAEHAQIHPVQILNPAVTQNLPKDGFPALVRMSEVKPELVEWLWPGRIALGKLTLIAGDPGLGKSFLTLDIASRVSSGSPWPDSPNNKMNSGGVVLLNAEDGISDTIRPRLDCAGADVSRIVAIESIHVVGKSLNPHTRGFDLSTDLPAIEEAINSVDCCRLVVIDPITAYLGKTDSHNNAEIRGLLAPLSDLAARYKVAVVAVTHLNKSGNGPAIYRTMGSLAFAAAARAAWAVTKDKTNDKRRLFIPIKNNIAPNTGGLAYQIASIGINGANVVWESDPVTLSADDALSSDRVEAGKPTEQDDVEVWLHSYLRDAPKRVNDILKDAKNAGYSVATLRRAKAGLGVVSNKEGVDSACWVWSLPTQLEISTLQKVLSENTSFNTNEHVRETTAKTSLNHMELPKVLNHKIVSPFDSNSLSSTPEDEIWGSSNG